MDGQVEAAHDRVADGYSGGMDFDQYLIILGRRLFYLFELKNIRSSVFCVDNCFHRFLQIQFVRERCDQDWTSGLRHFQAYQTTSETNTSCAVDQTNS